MNYDKILDKIFFIGNQYNKSKVISFNKLKQRKYINIYNYLNNRFIDSESNRETLYRIHYNIYNKPLCPVCNKKLKFYGRKNVLFLSHCSNKCKKLDKEVNEKWKQSCNDNVGTNRNKCRQTMLKRYGVENPYQIPEIIEKIKKTNKEKLQKSLYKQHQTCFKKYNVMYYIQTNEFKEKSKKTCLDKYSVEHPMKSKIVKDKYNWENIVNKIYITKKQNNTFNASAPEDQSYELLKEKYPDILRQYRSDVYPFNCDFYIPSLDLYIECQYAQFHHKRPYLGTEQDLKDIELLKEKANKSERHKMGKESQYDKIIYVWTDLDVKKRNIAKENNLNYIEFWTVDELKKWLSSYDNNR